jgi:hypothetical protein
LLGVCKGGTVLRDQVSVAVPRCFVQLPTRNWATIRELLRTFPLPRSIHLGRPKTCWVGSRQVVARCERRDVLVRTGALCVSDHTCSRRGADLTQKFRALSRLELVHDEGVFPARYPAATEHANREALIRGRVAGTKNTRRR